VLIALMVTMALSGMDNTVVSTAIPQVVRDLAGSPCSAGYSRPTR
jgi:hypothetical protein